MNTTGQSVLYAAVAGGLVFWAWCLRDVIRSEETAVRSFTKLVWLVIVALGSVAGATLWWIAGRPDRD